MDNCGPPWLFQIYQWMSQISEKYADVVTQHFLGMTYERRPMYYLKVSAKAESCLSGEEGSLSHPRYLFTIHGL